ncbi:helix-turn-helix domain-containing protein, partial [Algoriphagus algorifonticola]|uniref:helix-turn-helix domain-containing protein n=1 Tax=Algoriphagus algorifonticola TaxID=2593007 RepID=UPI002939331A
IYIVVAYISTSLNVTYCTFETTSSPIHICLNPEGVDKSAYSKIEKGTRAITVDELYKAAQLFNMTTDQILAYDGDIPSEVVIEDKTAVEQLRLIQQLEEEDRQTIFKLIDKMLTNKKFKDFFQKNVAAL